MSFLRTGELGRKWIIHAGDSQEDFELRAILWAHLVTTSQWLVENRLTGRLESTPALQSLPVPLLASNRPAVYTSRSFSVLVAITFEAILSMRPDPSLSGSAL
jgi:hypothetical protein